MRHQEYFHLLKVLLLCGIGVQETTCVRMNWLVICVQQQRGNDAPLWQAVLLSAPSAAFANEFHTKRLFDSTFWISSVSLTSCVISKKESSGEDSMVHCVMGCREVDKGSSTVQTFFVPVFNELREVQELTSAGLS